ncbi:hypothetical protein DL768_010326 [Monosporascus sp. mg162]|nr:hypothetical protein DL768_010326 [Monosporascus sp. mg162]
MQMQMMHRRPFHKLDYKTRRIYADARQTDSTGQSDPKEIVLLFQSAQKSSKRYETGAKQEDLVRLKDKDIPPVLRRLHDPLEAVARQRQKQTSVITGFVDDLEKLYPGGNAGRNYAKNIKSEKTARVRLGTEWDEDSLACGTTISDRTRILQIRSRRQERLRFTLEISTAGGISLITRTPLDGKADTKHRRIIQQY